MEIKRICKGVTVMFLAFLVGGMMAWFFSSWLELCHFTVLPIEMMESLFGI